MRPRLLLLLVMLAVGCGDKTPDGANVPLDEVPEPVIRVATEKLKGVRFEQAWKTPAGNYEVRGRAPNGKVRDIQVRPDGSVVEID